MSEKGDFPPYHSEKIRNRKVLFSKIERKGTNQKGGSGLSFMPSPNNTNSRYLLKVASIAFSVLIVFLGTLLVCIGNKANAETKCSPCAECPNPLVQTKPIKISGDLPDSLKDWSSNVFHNSYYNALGSKLNAEGEHLCADLYYIIEHYSGATERHGKKFGKAKYVIESWARIWAGEGEVPVLHKYGWDGSHWTKSEYKLVPRRGQIELHLDLISLRNGEKYDFGVQIIDVIDRAPEKESYDGVEKAVIDGKTYFGSDGLWRSDFDPGNLFFHDYIFEKGDVGVTIRKKETPSNCTIDVDDSSKYPPYYILRVNQIKNEFNEPLPNNVRIALKVAEGHILGGEKIDGWSVFTTKDGKITENVLYEPPSCDKAKKDKLEIAGVCEFHDGKPSICKSQIIEKTIAMKCHDVTVNITGTANWKRDDKRYTSELAMQIRITGTMKLKWAGKDAEDYECDRMQLHYQHHEKVVDKKKGCIETEISGTGSSTISEGSFILSFRRGQLTIKFDLEPLELNVKRECGKSSSEEKRKGLVTINMIVNEKLDRSQKIFTGHRTWGIPDLKKDLNRPGPSQGFFQIPFMSNEFDASKILEQFGVKAPATMQAFPSPGPDMKLEWKFEKTKTDDQKADSSNDKSERRKKRGSKRGSPSEN